jgi:hypothetical protein
MKYSPLVERYLMTHKYETMNNVKGWKMLLTQRHEAQKEVDRKFKAYAQIALQAKRRCDELNKEYQAEVALIQEQLKKDDLAAKQHIDVLKEQKIEKLQSGSCNEYSNMVVSVFNQENQDTKDLFDDMVKDRLDPKKD